MSLKYIAGKAGVSITTVSNVLNRKGHVSLKVAQKVRDIIQTDGITVKHRRRKRIFPARRYIAIADGEGLSLSANTAFHPQLLRGMQSILKTRGYSLLMPSTATPENVQKEIIGADALVLAGADCNPELFVGEVSVPVIWLFHSTGSVYDAVVGDDREIGRLAAEYLYSKGHRNVGYVGDLAVSSFVEYGLFFCHFMGRLGGKVVTATESGWFAPRSGDIEPDMVRLRGMIGILLTEKEKITAIFLPDNRVFAPVSAALKGIGVCPGDGLEILSCVNAASEIRGMPGCSAAIDINLEDMGKRVAECVFWRLDNQEETPIRISVCPRLVVADDEGRVRQV